MDQELGDLHELPPPSQDQAEQSISNEFASPSPTAIGWGISATPRCVTPVDEYATYSRTLVTETLDDEKFVYHFKSRISRKNAVKDLEWLREIRRHARINLSIIELHGEEGLGERPSVPVHLEREIQDTNDYEESALDINQQRFAHHHTGISEMLKTFSGAYYAVPDNIKFRYGRNWFCHTFPTPHGYGRGMSRVIEGAKGLYEELLLDVDHAITQLNSLLQDDGAWEKNKPESDLKLPSVSWGDENDPITYDPAPNKQDDGNSVQPSYHAEVKEEEARPKTRKPLRSAIRFCYQRSQRTRRAIDWLYEVVEDLWQPDDYAEFEEFEESQDFFQG